MAYRNTFFRWLFLYSLTFGLTYVLKLFTYLCPETGHISRSCPFAKNPLEKKQKTGRVLAAVGPNADAFAPPAATEFVLENKFCPPCFLFFL